MFTYHSKFAPVRVTVVGEYNVNSEVLLIAVSRCSKKDSFIKKSIVIPARKAFEVQTKEGKLLIPGRKEKIIKGGLQIATERLESGHYFLVIEMDYCNAHKFNLIARGVAEMAIHSMRLVEISKY